MSVAEPTAVDFRGRGSQVRPGTPVRLAVSFKGIDHRLSSLLAVERTSREPEDEPHSERDS